MTDAYGQRLGERIRAEHAQAIITRGLREADLAVTEIRLFPRRTLATPQPIKDWSLTSLKEKLIKISAKVASHGRYVAFQMVESRHLYGDCYLLLGLR